MLKKRNNGWKIGPPQERQTSGDTYRASGYHTGFWPHRVCAVCRLSRGAAGGLSCFTACEIFEPTSPALDAGFWTTGAPEKSPTFFYSITYNFKIRKNNTNILLMDTICNTESTKIHYQQGWVRSEYTSALMLLRTKCFCHLKAIFRNPNPFRRWGFGRCLGREGRALMNGISVFIEETPETAFFLLSLPCQNTTGWPSARQKIGLTRHWMCWHLIMDFPASRAPLC